jgi:hypothetical protein
MAKITSLDHFIPTLLERKSDGVYAFAYCPICDKVEKSSGDEYGEHRVTAASVAKIREHIRLRHSMR